MQCEVLEQTLSVLSIGCLGCTCLCDLPVELCAGQDTGGLLKRGIEGDQCSFTSCFMVVVGKGGLGPTEPSCGKETLILLTLEVDTK